MVYLYLEYTTPLLNRFLPLDKLPKLDPVHRLRAVGLDQFDWKSRCIPETVVWLQTLILGIKRVWYFELILEPLAMKCMFLFWVCCVRNNLKSLVVRNPREFSVQRLVFRLQPITKLASVWCVVFSNLFRLEVISYSSPHVFQLFWLSSTEHKINSSNCFCSYNISQWVPKQYFTILTFTETSSFVLLQEKHRFGMLCYNCHFWVSHSLNLSPAGQYYLHIMNAIWVPNWPY